MTIFRSATLFLAIGPMVLAIACGSSGPVSHLSDTEIERQFQSCLAKAEKLPSAGDYVMARADCQRWKAEELSLLKADGVQGGK